MLSAAFSCAASPTPSSATARLALDPPTLRLTTEQMNITDAALRVQARASGGPDEAWGPEVEEVESQLRKIPNLVHYLRIAKTGSTSLLAMFETAKKRAPEACARLGTHFHNVLPRHLRERQPAAMFAVLREPHKGRQLPQDRQQERQPHDARVHDKHDHHDSIYIT